MPGDPVDVQADARPRQRQASGPSGRGSLRMLMRRRSTIAFVMDVRNPASTARPSAHATIHTRC